ncbi:GntR family transcriptional regulator [Terrilactibacillus laevilacticus]|uniref:GntR family transcriptional regulator n=1 Tax=Terrilactibacillus laevilacticus TaxID=1380157 RepID=UPI001146701A|nr:GntR family transcriptional regulator [Terrilactibacillus laevilacticus]
MEKLKLGSIKKETVHQEAYRKLKQAILTGVLEGGRYYTEVELANVLDISRTPVREAVKDLINDNLLEAVPRKGLVVKSFSDIEIEQVFLLRKIIECEMVKKVVSIVNQEMIEYLENIINEQQRMIEKNDQITFMILDQKFHNEMIRFTKYELVEDTITKLHNLIRLFGHRAITEGGRMEEVIVEHQSMIEAMKSKDINLAVKAMEYHLAATKKSLWRVEHKREEE